MKANRELNARSAFGRMLIDNDTLVGFSPENAAIVKEFVLFQDTIVVVNFVLSNSSHLQVYSNLNTLTIYDYLFI